MRSYPDTYTLTFSKDRYDNDNPRLHGEREKLTVNDIVFTIDSIETDAKGTILHYKAIGYPSQIAATVSRDETPFFDGWEDVGLEYLETYDYD